MVISRAHGGTLTLWLKELDPYIEVIATDTTAFLPIVLKMPGLQTTVHISLYMPTHSKDSEFVSDLAELRNCLDNLVERYTDPVIYIRGDGNVNANNTPRVILLQQFIRDYELVSIKIGHNTYHHFVGDGLYDSDIDVILHTVHEQVTENVTNILCKHDDPAILSHHDVILSRFTIPTLPTTQPRQLNNIAPKIEHSRTKNKLVKRWTA